MLSITELISNLSVYISSIVKKPGSFKGKTSTLYTQFYDINYSKERLDAIYKYCSKLTEDLLISLFFTHQLIMIFWNNVLIEFYISINFDQLNGPLQTYWNISRLLLLLPMNAILGLLKITILPIIPYIISPFISLLKIFPTIKKGYSFERGLSMAIGLASINFSYTDDFIFTMLRNTNLYIASIYTTLLTLSCISVFFVEITHIIIPKKSSSPVIQDFLNRLHKLLIDIKSSKVYLAFTLILFTFISSDYLSMTMRLIYFNSVMCYTLFTESILGSSLFCLGLFIQYQEYIITSLKNCYELSLAYTALLLTKLGYTASKLISYINIDRLKKLGFKPETLQHAKVNAYKLVNGGYNGTAVKNAYNSKLTTHKKLEGIRISNKGQRLAATWETKDDIISSIENNEITRMEYFVTSDNYLYELDSLIKTWESGTNLFIHYNHLDYDQGKNKLIMSEEDKDRLKDRALALKWSNTTTHNELGKKLENIFTKAKTLQSNKFTKIPKATLELIKDIAYKLKSNESKTKDDTYLDETSKLREKYYDHVQKELNEEQKEKLENLNILGGVDDEYQLKNVMKKLFKGKYCVSSFYTCVTYTLNHMNQDQTKFENVQTIPPWQKSRTTHVLANPAIH